MDINYEAISTVFAMLITLGVGRIWYLTDRHDKETTESVKDLYKVIAEQNKLYNERIEKVQAQVSENSKHISLAIERIDANTKTDNLRMLHVEKMLDKLLAS